MFYFVWRNTELSLTWLSLEPDWCKHTKHSTESGGNFPRSEVASPLGQLSHQDSYILVFKLALLLTQLLNQPIYSFILRRRSIQSVKLITQPHPVWMSCSLWCGAQAQGQFKTYYLRLGPETWWFKSCSLLGREWFEIFTRRPIFWWF
jgi:hypothetical protein